MPWDGVDIEGDQRVRDLAERHRTTVEGLLKGISPRDFNMQQWEECICGQLARFQIDGWHVPVEGSNPRRTVGSNRGVCNDFADYIGVSLDTATNMLTSAMYYGCALREVTVEQVLAKLNAAPYRVTEGLCREAEGLDWRDSDLWERLSPRTADVTIDLTVLSASTNRRPGLVDRLRRWIDGMINQGSASPA